MSFQIVLIALHGELHASITAWRAVRDKQVDALRREREELVLTLEQSIELLQESDDEEADFPTDDEDL